MANPGVQKTAWKMLLRILSANAVASTPASMVALKACALTSSIIFAILWGQKNGWTMLAIKLLLLPKIKSDSSSDNFALK